MFRPDERCTVCRLVRLGRCTEAMPKSNRVCRREHGSWRRVIGALDECSATHPAWRSKTVIHRTKKRMQQSRDVHEGDSRKKKCFVF